MRKTAAREGVVGAVQNECSGMDEPLDIKGFHITGHPDDDVNGVYTKRDYGGLSNEQRKMKQQHKEPAPETDKTWPTEKRGGKTIAVFSEASEKGKKGEGVPEEPEKDKRKLALK